MRNIETMQSFSKMETGTSQTPSQQSVINSSSPSKNVAGNINLYQRFNVAETPGRFINQLPYSMGPIAQYRDNPYRVPSNEYIRSSTTPTSSFGLSGTSNVAVVSIGSGSDSMKLSYTQNTESNTQTINSMHATKSIITGTASPSGNIGRQKYLLQQNDSNQIGQAPPDPGGTQQPYKKIRLTDSNRLIDQQQPQPITTSITSNSADNGFKPTKNLDISVPISKHLNIDTREIKGTSSETYNPQVEAISPTMPNDAFEIRTVKDDLIMQINKVDMELANAERTKKNLCGKIKILEETSNKPVQYKNKIQLQLKKHQNIIHKIYEENRKKAALQHSAINSFWQSDLPMYNQPSDVEICEEIMTRYHTTFKYRLIVYLKKIKLAKSLTNNSLAEKYKKLTTEWTKKVEKIESNTKRRTKELKNREFFEKVFVELRKQREEKERFNRVGSRVKSEADLEEIMDGLQEQALEDKKMRSYAVIPPLMLEKHQRNIVYQNENGIILDMLSDYKDKQHLNLWTTGEKEIFKEKFLQHPKNFGLIAASLDRKSVQDCIRYYYLSKKMENYKQLLRKSRQRTRSSRNPQKIQQSQTQCIIDSLTTGVTTRLQREQQQKTNIRSSGHSTRSGNESFTSSLESFATGTVTRTSIEPQKDTSTPIVLEPALPLQPVNICAETNSKSDIEVKNALTNDLKELESKDSLQASQPKNNEQATVVVSAEENHKKLTVSEENQSTEINIVPDHQELKPQKFTEATKETESASLKVEANVNIVDKEAFKENIDNTRADDMPAHTQNAESKEIDDTSKTFGNEKPNTCFICKAESCHHTRPLKKGRAHQYGLLDEAIPIGARVCNSCQCKSIRNRFMNCPLPTCPNVRDRVKRRLHNFSQKLAHLSVEDRLTIFKEFQIPKSATKCCTACLMRIRRKLDPLTEIDDKNKNDDIESDVSTSTCDDVDNDDDGSDSISNENNMCSNTPKSTIINKSLDDDKLHPPTSQAPKKQKTSEEYDSSATETADEENEMSPANGSQTDQSSTNVRDFLFNVIERSLKTTSTNPKMKAAGASFKSQQHQQTPSNFQQPQIVGASEQESSNTLKKGNNNSSVISSLSANSIENVDNLATLSLVKSQSHFSSAVTPINHSGTTITQVKSSIQPTYEQKCNQNYEPNESEEQTLDLSIKKSLKEQVVSSSSPMSVVPVPHIISSQYKSTAGSSGQQGVTYIPYHTSADSHNMTQLPISVPPTTLTQTRQHPQQTCIISQHHMQSKLNITQKLSPKPQQSTIQNINSASVSGPKGSITHGTPFVLANTSLSPRFDNVFMQQNTFPNQESNKQGSITQGTPILAAGHNVGEKRPFDYNKNNSRLNSNQNHAVTSSNVTQSIQSNSQHSAKYPKSQYMSPVYGLDHSCKLSTRQLVMRDYFTSQQMHGQQKTVPKNDSKDDHSSRNTVGISPSVYFLEKEKSLEHSNSATSPRHASPPQRQGVIQRHNTGHAKSASPAFANEIPHSYPLRGHEAFSSLVEVAVQQPQLPVPQKDELIPEQKMLPSHTDIKYIPMMRDHTFRSQPKVELMEKDSNRSHPQLEKAHHTEQRMVHDKDDHRRDRIYHVNSLNALSYSPTKSVSVSEKDSFNRNSMIKPSDGQFSAKNLIDAIITQSINQGTTDPQNYRENLRHSYYTVRDPSREQHATISAVSNENNVTKENSSSNISTEFEREHKSNNTNSDIQQIFPKSITIGELTNSIIAKDYGTNSNTLRQFIPFVNEQPGPGSDQWKLRKQQQQKGYDSLTDSSKNIESINCPPHTSPKNKYSNDRAQFNYYSQQQSHSNLNGINLPVVNNSIKVMDRIMVSTANSNAASSRPPHQFTLDCYVKNRIVEAMRTEDDRHDETQYELNDKNYRQQVDPNNAGAPKSIPISTEKRRNSINSTMKRHENDYPTFNHKTLYPFSALNVQGQASSSTIHLTNKSSDICTQSTNQHSSPPEPKPLLSAQYEALSDEE